MAEIRNIRTIDATTYPYIFEQNVSVPLSNGGVIRCNVYRPKAEKGHKFPVIATCGPYGKDVPYKDFHPKSFSEIDPPHQTEHSAWETPTPKYWTAHGYVVVRADEIGIGQSPGLLSVKSSRTIDAFADLIEWASVQPWSSGKVGLLGVSYYAVTQWQVASRNPKGLAAIIPWEGFSDPYTESVRHGGILSNSFFAWWYKRQVAPNQYGLPGRAARNWGPDTIEGDLAEEELAANRTASTDFLHKHRYRDHPAFASVQFNLEDVKVPLLSVANWGGIMLHLRGNVVGYMRAGSEFKYLRFITGRHDLPFYYPEEVEVQRSFLDAFLKGDDREGWTVKGRVPPVNLILRKGNVGYNNPTAEKTYFRRTEAEWPLARTRYVDVFLTSGSELLFEQPVGVPTAKATYRALGTATPADTLSFQTRPFEEETEVTGHIVVHLNVSMSGDRWGSTPSDLDLFLSLRHISPAGDEIFYTGSAGEAVPLAKGFLRVSLRKTNPENPKHRSYLPHRDFLSTDLLSVIPNEVYPVDVEIWPTNVIVGVGGRLVLDVSSGDTAGTGFWGHNDPDDRSESVFKGSNHIHFGGCYINYMTLPIIYPE
ncbi:hypothetical protein VE01_02513 [Pseudogymnoascus verrucosus]|uniref:Xaa-Pro dipeptidyl-peptidase C-terminal domain-containing protein n=1 Tax=Pseudogymnoascus verrucosus TaxID=342668 RepID=A0A1B8GT35_9PEZI|nr:uncharacterized protein VE01_02513 [Pseudogymnoascus verrucosus]OBT99002.1 hypothetical protein VE01_02513 [Pseudogymnoascus verrucosus]